MGKRRSIRVRGRSHRDAVGCLVVAFPFGSTSYGQYALWAQSAGCECNFGHDPNSNLPCLRIVAPNGRKVHIADVDQLERLTTSTLNYLDRRLGLKSPFPRAHYDD